MALGNHNRIQGKSYSIKLRLKQGDDFLDNAIFELQKKVGEEYVPFTDEEREALTGSTDPLRDVAGDLVKLDTRQGEYEGSPVYSVTIALQDPVRGEVYYINASLGSSLVRGLANSILNLKAFNNVEIGLYGKKNKETKKIYPTVALRQGGVQDTVKWKYDTKQEGCPLPAVREFVGRGGKTERDYSAQEKFLYEQLKEFGKVVGAAAKNKPAHAPAQPQPAAGTPPATRTPPPAQEGADEDVPF